MPGKRWLKMGANSVSQKLRKRNIDEISWAKETAILGDFEPGSAAGGAFAPPPNAEWAASIRATAWRLADLRQGYEQKVRT